MPKGNDKNVSEKFLVEDVELFSPAELKGYELYNNENDIVSIKRSNLKELVNKRRDEADKVFYITLESLFIDDNGENKEIHYVVAMFAKNVEDAHSLAREYIKGSLEDMTIVAIKKTKILDII